MKINCTIDGKNRSLVVNSDKPLLQILMDDLEVESMMSICKGAYCGNCIVMINGKAALSCLVPAFRIQGAVIQTFDSFRKTRAFRDIDRAYREVGVSPCRLCFASKTLIIESILQTVEKRRAALESALQNEPYRQPYTAESLKKSMEALIMNELSLNACVCVESNELIKVVEACLEYRRKRNVRRS